MPEAHKRAYRHPKYKTSYRHNGIGSAYDTTIPGKWPISLEQIKMKVHVWHAGPDVLVGNMPIYIAEKLPNSELKVISNAGHLWILDHMKEVMETLVASS